MSKFLKFLEECKCSGDDCKCKKGEKCDNPSCTCGNGIKGKTSKYTSEVCDNCGGKVKEITYPKLGTVKVCSNPDCKDSKKKSVKEAVKPQTTKVCDECGGTVITKNFPSGPVWICKNTKCKNSTPSNSTADSMGNWKKNSEKDKDARQKKEADGKNESMFDKYLSMLSESV